MKVFAKWFALALLFFTVLVMVIVITGEARSSVGEIIVIVVTASVAFGIVFYLIEVRYIPWRKIRLMKRVTNVFNAEPVTAEIVRFKAGRFDVYADLEFALAMSAYGAYNESVNFYIPKSQVDGLPAKPDFKFVEAQCNGIACYRFYQTNSFGLKLARKRFEKRLARW